MTTFPIDFDLEHPVFGGIADDPVEDPAVLLLIRTVDAAMFLHRTGNRVTPDAIHDHDRELPVEPVTRVMASQRFREAMREAGVETYARGRISPEQQAFLAQYFHPDVITRSKAEKLRVTGVSQAKLNGWLRSPEFAKEFDQTSEEIAGTLKADAMLVLQRKLDEGDLSTARFALQMTGRFDPDGLQAQTQQVLLTIFNILDEELNDPAHRGLMKRIGDRVEEVMPYLVAGKLAPQRTVPPQVEVPHAEVPAIPATFVVVPEPPAESFPATIADEWVVDLSRPNLRPPPPQVPPRDEV